MLRLREQWDTEIAEFDQGPRRALFLRAGVERNCGAGKPVVRHGHTIEPVPSVAACLSRK